MNSNLKTYINKIGSPKIFVYLIIWLMVLTFFGTIAQKDLGLYLVQLDYFSSWRECVAGAEICAVMTEWNEFRGIDLKELKSLLKNPRIFDAKNIYSIEKLKSFQFKYENIGRNI